MNSFYPKKILVLIAFSFLFLAVPPFFFSTTAATANNCTSTSHLILRPFNAAPGSKVQATGKCFDGNATVSVELCYSSGTGCALVASPTANGTGYFVVSFTVPLATSPGAHVMKATETSVGSKIASNTLTVIPSLKLLPVRGIVGSITDVTGVGFQSMTTITITLGGSPIQSTITNSSGAFFASFLVPHTPAGSYSVTATDGKFSATKSFTVVPFVSPPFNHTALPGGNLRLIGSGFAANSLVTFIMSNGANLGSVTTNVNGDFTYFAPIPSNTPIGKYTISCTDASGNSKTITFHTV